MTRINMVFGTVFGLFWNEGDVVRNIATEVAGEYAGLDGEELLEEDFLLEKGMV